MERALVPARLPVLLRAVHAALVEHRDEIDALNVFPVPDGDTGTNLEATAAAVVEALLLEDHDASTLVDAALRSARGNSGVIFSQVVRAVVEAVGDPAATGDVGVLAAALDRADALARRAIAAPVEGTILTALRTAADVAAVARDAGEDDLPAVLARTRHAVSDAVRATQEQMDVLRDAGVVDAGARGFEVVVTAIESVVTGEHVEPDVLANVVPRCMPGLDGDVAAAPWEVQFVVAGDGEAADGLRTDLATIGDSVVVVEANGLVQAHVHTADVDAATARGREVGDLQDLRVTDLRPPSDDTQAPTLAIVAVLPAGGLADLGRGSGACIVDGAAGALPSVDDLLVAIAAVPTGPVVVLPGHPNVVPTARQAADLADRAVAVVAAADHPLVALACLALQTSDVEELQATASGCTAGEVVAAVRDADLAFGAVRSGQPLVVVGGDVVAAADDVADALAQLLSHLGAPSSELVTVAVGADAGLDPGGVMMAALPVVGDAEVEVLDGGQRPALLFAVVEG